MLELFKDHADAEVLVFWRPQLESGKQPDVVVYWPELGLILYEIKDWVIDQIEKADPNEWTIKFGRVRSAKTAPLKQARQYFYQLREQLERERCLLSEDPKHRGKLKIPIATAVAFPNISRADFLSRNLDKVLPVKFVMFGDDIEEIRNGRKSFFHILKAHFDPWWRNDALSQQERDILRKILFPRVTLDWKLRRINLDAYQEKILDSLLASKGHHIIRGVAGSGKSLIVAKYAAELAKQHPEWRILVTCYNISLASQLRNYVRFFSNFSGNVHVAHFHQLAKEILGNIPQLVCIEIENSTDELWKQEAVKDEERSKMLGEALKKYLRAHKPILYDAILIDEAQDFHPTWFESLLLILNKDTNTLLLAEDGAQKVFPRTFTYKGVGINAVGRRVKTLKKTYRCTQQIISLATKIIMKKDDWDEFYRNYIAQASENDLFSNSEVSAAAGEFPRLVVEKDYNRIIDFIVKDIKKETTGDLPLQYNDFGILYLVRIHNDHDYVRPIIEALRCNGIPHFWLSKDRDSKQNYDPFNNCVTVSTIFSAKGLEFHTVYLVGLELFPWPLRSSEANNSILYVAITRARRRLVMFSTVENDTTRRIRQYLDEIQTM